MIANKVIRTPRLFIIIVQCTTTGNCDTFRRNLSTLYTPSQRTGIGKSIACCIYRLGKLDIVAGKTILSCFVADLHHILAAHRKSYVTRKWVQRCRKERKRVKLCNCSRLPTLCAIGKIGILYRCTILGSNLLWQVTKIIRELQALGFRFHTAGYRFRYLWWLWAFPKLCWVSFLIPTRLGESFCLCWDTSHWQLGIVFDTRVCRTINHWLSVRLESLAPLSILPILI